MSSLASALIGRDAAPALKEYDSFDAALRDSDSYEDPRIIEVVSKKTRRFRDSLARDGTRRIASRQAAQNLFVLSCLERDGPQNILEVGGACGAGYFEMKHLLPDRIGRWAICETPAMTAAGKQITDDSGLSFHEDFTSAATALERLDLVIAQGVLQYSSDPLRMLKDLFELDVSYLYVTRTVVTVEGGATADGPIFSKQETDISAHGPGKLPEGIADGKSSQPLTIASLEAISSNIPAASELIYWFDESDDRVMTVGKRMLTIRDVGFLARKTNS